MGVHDLTGCHNTSPAAHQTWLLRLRNAKGFLGLVGFLETGPCPATQARVWSGHTACVFLSGVTVSLCVSCAMYQGRVAPAGRRASRAARGGARGGRRRWASRCLRLVPRAGQWPCWPVQNDGKKNGHVRASAASARGVRAGRGPAPGGGGAHHIEIRIWR